MSIRFKCKCGRKFEVADAMAGRKARCTDCGLTFLVPTPGAAAGKQTAKAEAPVDDSPLAQIARAAQASKQAQAAKPAPGAKPAPAAAAKPAAPAQAARPAAPAAPAASAIPSTIKPAVSHMTPRPAAPQAAPARPAGPAQASAPLKPAARPAAPARPTKIAPPPPPPPTSLRPAQAAYAYEMDDDDDDLPVARLASPKKKKNEQSAKIGRRKPNLTPIQIVAVLSIIISMVVLVDSIMTTAGARKIASGFGLIYGLAAVFAGIGIILALVAATGNRFCIGVLFGGAVMNVINGVALIIMGIFKGNYITQQGAKFHIVVIVAGVVALLSGIVYILVPLLNKAVRHYMFSKTGVFVAGAVVGFILFPVASTAEPSAGLVWLRSETIVAGGQGTGIVSGPEGAFATAGAPESKEDIENRTAMQSRLEDVFDAIAGFYKDTGRLPADLGQLGDRVNVLAFFSPSKGQDVKARVSEGKFIDPIDLVYLCKDHTEEQITANKALEELIVAYSAPGVKIGNGVLVVRAPGAPKKVELLDKATFEKQVEASRKWVAANIPAVDTRPKDLPSFK